MIIPLVFCLGLKSHNKIQPCLYKTPKLPMQFMQYTVHFVQIYIQICSLPLFFSLGKLQIPRTVWVCKIGINIAF